MKKYTITDKQKHILVMIIETIVSGKEIEPIIPICTHDGCSILGIPENFGRNLIGDLNILCDEGFLAQNFYQKGDPLYTVKQTAFLAVKNGFQTDEDDSEPKINIGAIIHNMSGGNIQAVGSSYKSEIEQIVLDKSLFSEQINDMCSQLKEAVRTEITDENLKNYIKRIEELKVEASVEKPSQSKINTIFKSLAFLGDIEGTIALTSRVWPYLYPLLLLITEKISLIK